MLFGPMHIRQICSRTVDYVTQMGVLAGRLKEKKYLREIVDNAWVRTLEIDRKDCLKEKWRMESKDNDNGKKI